MSSLLPSKVNIFSFNRSEFFVKYKNAKIYMECYYNKLLLCLTDSNGITSKKQSSDVELKNSDGTCEPIRKRCKTLSRRSSNQSIKSDSSLLSNGRDKINRVSTSQNTDDSESSNLTGNVLVRSDEEVMDCITKQKHVEQVDQESKQPVISPQSKAKISDKLIKILSQSEDAIKTIVEPFDRFSEVSVEKCSENKDASKNKCPLVQKNKQDDCVSANNSNLGNIHADMAYEENVINLPSENTASTIESNKMDLVNMDAPCNGSSCSEEQRGIDDSKRKRQKQVVSSNDDKSVKRVESLERLKDELRNDMNKSDGNGTNNANTSLLQTEDGPSELMDVKSEPCSDEDVTGEESLESTQTSGDKSQTCVESKRDKSKAVDNLTNVINEVASGRISGTVSTSTPKSSVIYRRTKIVGSHSKQTARKTFPCSATKTSKAQASPNTTLLTQSIDAKALPGNRAHQNSTMSPLIAVVQTKRGPDGSVIIPGVSFASRTTSNLSELNESQNYIPQNQPVSVEKAKAVNLNALDDPSLCSSSNTTAVGSTGQVMSNIMEEFCALKDVLPETAARAVSDLMSRPPPLLKPRPPSVLSQGFEESTPSSAGFVSAQLNSLAYRVRIIS